MAKLNFQFLKIFLTSMFWMAVYIITISRKQRTKLFSVPVKFQQLLVFVWDFIFSVFQPFQFNSATWTGLPCNQTIELAIGAGKVIPPVSDILYTSFSESLSQSSVKSSFALEASAFAAYWSSTPHWLCIAKVYNVSHQKSLCFAP